MIVKLTTEMLALIGATSAEDFPGKLSAYVANAKQMEKVMAESPDFTSLEKRISAVESAVKGIPTEARIGEIVGASVANAVPTAMTAWAGSESGKQLIGAEASRITMAAIAAVGTVPVKSSPAPANNKTVEQEIENLQKAGKFEEAYALLPVNQQSEWLGAKSYAAYKRAQSRGRVQITDRATDFNN